MIKTIEQFLSAAMRFKQGQISGPLLGYHEGASKLFFVRIQRWQFPPFNLGSRKLSNVRVDRAARIHSSCAGPFKLQNRLPPLRSNDLLYAAVSKLLWWAIGFL